MKASVLMATRANPGWDKYLSSLLDQSTRPGEVIVVVDRPSDTNEKQQFKERWPDIVFIFNEINVGLTASLNRGLAAASGEVIFRADDDDIYRSDRIEKQLSCFAETGADIVGSWAEGSASPKNAVTYLITCPTDNVGIIASLLRRNILVHSSLAFRRARILELGGYDETYHYAQDYALYLAAIRKGYKFAAVAETLVVRHYSEHSITVSHRLNQLMFSCAARINHHAHDGNRIAFLSTLFSYALLAITPQWLRHLRRRFFILIGRGA